MAIAADMPPTTSTIVYVGTYTGEQSQGIYAFRLANDTGRMEPLGLAAETKNPSFLAVDDRAKRVVAVSEISEYEGKTTGAVSSFKADPSTGKLTLLNKKPSQGKGPCYVSLSADGGCAFVANYGQGSVASLPVGANGELADAASAIQHEGKSVHPKRQQGPHAHSINPDPTGKFVLAADLGLDKLLVYGFDAATEKLTPHSTPAIVTPPGSGPRHFAFHPSGKYLYVATELANTVLVYAYENGDGRELQNITMLPDGYTSTSHAAEVLVHPSGKFVYASNRGHDSIAIFGVDTDAGKLTAQGHVSTGGKTPRGFGIDPTGNWLIAANQESGNLLVFRIDQSTGDLTQTGEPITLSRPVCVRFMTGR